MTFHTPPEWEAAADSGGKIPILSMQFGENRLREREIS